MSQKNMDFKEIYAATDVIRLYMEQAESKIESGHMKKDWVIKQLQSLVINNIGVKDEVINDIKILIDNNLVEQVIDIIANTSRGIYNINKVNFKVAPPQYNVFYRSSQHRFI